MNEQRINLIQQALERSEEGHDAALILMKQAVPCILHFENRDSEKNSHSCTRLHGKVLAMQTMAFASEPE